VRIDTCVRGLVAASLVSIAAQAGAESEASAIFAKKCSSCHTFGKGDLIGPDLKGVNARHPRPWLLAWVRSSENVIRSGDASAVNLFRRYKQQRMPDHALSREQIEGLLDYLASGGPEADAAAQLRNASTATSQEVDLGQGLFYGHVTLANGDAPCASCHSVFKQASVGSLGADLTRAYSKYQDRGLSSLLRKSCFPRTPSLDGRAAVTSQESFALKAFLRQTDVRSHAN
jgi:mono/diheme cytochrome c family protein